VERGDHGRRRARGEPEQQPGREQEGGTDGGEPERTGSGHGGLLGARLRVEGPAVTDEESDALHALPVDFVLRRTESSKSPLLVAARVPGFAGSPALGLPVLRIEHGEDRLEDLRPERLSEVVVQRHHGGVQRGERADGPPGEEAVVHPARDVGRE
jgi:hypothetical protein